MMAGVFVCLQVLNMAVMMTRLAMGRSMAGGGEQGNREWVGARGAARIMPRPAD